MLDESVLWTGVLTADQLAAVYAMGLQATSLATEPAPINPSVNPDFYWKFETGTPLAATFGAIPFTTNSGATLQTTGGQVADHFLYASASSHVLATTAPSSINLEDNFTISLWVNPTTNGARDIVSKWETATVANQEFRISTTAGGLVVFHYQLATPLVGSITSIEALPTATWSHIAITRKGAALYLYINGRPQAVANVGADLMIDVPGSALSVGGNSISASSYFDGRIDDLVIYKEYLQERKLRFNIDRGMLGDPVVP